MGQEVTQWSKISHILKLCMRLTDINMATPNFKYFLVFKIWKIFVLNEPGLKDFCAFFKWRRAGPQKSPTVNSQVHFFVIYEKKW